jgi:hypothetical protein
MSCVCKMRDSERCANEKQKEEDNLRGCRCKKGKMVAWKGYSMMTIIYKTERTIKNNGLRSIASSGASQARLGQ